MQIVVQRTISKKKIYILACIVECLNEIENIVFEPTKFFVNRPDFETLPTGMYTKMSTKSQINKER